MNVATEDLAWMLNTLVNFVYDSDRFVKRYEYILDKYTKYTNILEEYNSNVNVPEHLWEKPKK
jgi:hypothetical protein